jgi:DNA polymerase-3 subunit delta'
LRFSAVVGHTKLKQRLLSSVEEQRVPHAQLFHGPEGTGSLPLALAYATYLSCTNRKDGDSCGECPSCIKYDKLVHPDLHFVFPVFTTKSVSSHPVSDDFIGEWRSGLLENPYMTLQQWYTQLGLENNQGIINKWESEAILRKLNLKAFESDYKVMIIWMPEKMNLPAANKLLKMIEEPPPMTVFLMVAVNTGDILPTILSRTQLIRVPGLSDRELLQALKSTYDLDEDAMITAVKQAEGSFSHAVDLLNRGEEMAYQLELFMRIMRLAYSRKFQEIFDWVEEVAGLGRERQKSFFTYALRMVRENYLLNMDERKLVRLSPAEEDFSKKFSAFIHEGNAEQIIGELNDASLHIEANAYARIILLDFALKLVKLIR